jgi:hypothetical protein
MFIQALITRIKRKNQKFMISLAKILRTGNNPYAKN